VAIMLHPFSALIPCRLDTARLSTLAANIAAECSKFCRIASPQHLYYTALKWANRTVLSHIEMIGFDRIVECFADSLLTVRLKPENVVRLRG
jgi:hypothetical protein